MGDAMTSDDRKAALAKVHQSMHEEYHEMTRDDIESMAKNEHGIYAFTVEGLERFVALIAAAEREACAKLCEEKETYGDPVQCWLDDCAASIRARGKSNDQT